MSIDKKYSELLERHISDPEIIKDLGVFTRRMYMSRVLGHFELFKKIHLLPGDIVELGVYKGETLLNFAKFLEILNPGDRTKRVIGFDHWQGLQNFTDKDGKTFEDCGNVEGGWDPSSFKDTLIDLASLFDEDSFVPQKSRISLVDGDITKTVFDYVKENPGLRINLLHFDCDMYEPTLAGLKALYPHVVTGGIVLFDEFGIDKWAGESAAVDEYFEGKAPKMEKFPWLSTPGGWFVK
jgi:hypothetical protein